ncbi:MAG TPA: YdjY domain-containing protein [Planctomycetota bacterium]
MLPMIAALLAVQGVTADAAKKEVRVACKIAPRKLPNLPEIYPIEVIATHPAPKGQKAHETVVTFEAAPSEVHKALESIGLKPGKPVRGEGQVTGAGLEVLLEMPDKRQVRVETLLSEKKTGKPLPPLLWHFTGSAQKDGKFGADVSGTLISLYPVTDETVMQSALTMKEEGLIKMDTMKGALPPEGTAVTLILRAAAGPPPAPAAAALDPERQVTVLSRAAGPGPLPPPAVTPGLAPPATGVADPFEHRREVRATIPDVVKPVDAK